MRPKHAIVAPAATLLFGACALLPASPSCDTRKTVCVETVRLKNSDGKEYWLESRAPGAVTVRVDAAFVNMESSAGFPITVVLRGPSRRRLAVFKPVPERESWDSEYSFKWRWGDMTARHDDGAVYALPFSPGTTVRVGQGYHGKLSHVGLDEYALDFEAPAGTPVLAARGGIVVDVVQKYKKGATSSDLDGKANLIVVEHPDRTLGEYVHLMHHGARVKVGQKVAAGQLLGYSGNTGHTTGPHLHFGVYTAIDADSSKSLPVKFDVGGPRPEELLEGKTYVAHALPDTD